MTRLTAAKKARKKQSEFQKLWASAEKLKQNNARFRDRLDEIMQRMETDIRPVEVATAQQQIPLLRRLLDLGQRKSMTQWERQELDDWIREILDSLQSSGSVGSEVLDDISRYDAFRSGVELDEDSEISLPDQVRNHYEDEEKQEQEDEKVDEEVWRSEVEAEVEQILKQTFGAEPPKPQKSDIDDFFQDELFEEQQRLYDEYHKARNIAREELLEEMLADTSPFSEQEDAFFGFDFDDSDTDVPSSAEDTPAISNSIFKRLFRAAAGKLHPDREANPDMREKKHQLMAKLLSARKAGDVMTIVQMYQQHVADDAALSKADENQLIEVLRRQMRELQCEQEEYRFQSPRHLAAFESFYYPSRKKTNQAFKNHIQVMKKSASEAESLSLEIKSLVTLKPYLEQRYDDHRFTNPFEILDEIFESRY